MHLLLLRKKDCKSPTFTATKIKWADNNVDRNLLKDKIFDCLYGAGDVLGKDVTPSPDWGNKNYHEVVYCFALAKGQCNKIFGHNLKFTFNKLTNAKAQLLKFRAKFHDSRDLLGSPEYSISAGDLLLVSTGCGVLELRCGVSAKELVAVKDSMIEKLGKDKVKDRALEEILLAYESSLFE